MHFDKVRNVERYSLIEMSGTLWTSSPKPDALPGCATPRYVVLYLFYSSFQQLKEKENETNYKQM